MQKEEDISLVIGLLSWLLLLIHGLKKHQAGENTLPYKYANYSWNKGQE